MRVAFLITSPYQVHHYKWIARHLPEAHAVIEVRDREYGLSEELVERHLAPAGIHWVSRERLSTLDGRFDAIVCQTPVLPLEFLSSTYVVAQQYSLAKERYQYGVWRAHAHLNLMYGDYSVRKVGGFSNAVAVGNPLLDPCLGELAGPRRGLAASGRRPRLLYLPTYGELSSVRSVLPRLRGIDAEITVKPHHAEPGGPLAGPVDGVRVADPDSDPALLLSEHDGVISDFSGAAYDALYAGLPVVLAGSADPRGREVSRLSPQERDRTSLDGLAATWPPGGDLLEAFVVAEQLLDTTGYKEFLEARFVNPGSAGAACASEILRLVAEGETDHFGAQQVREATGRYILSLRRRRGGDGQDGLPTPLRLARAVYRYAPVDLPLAYRRSRRLLARSPTVHRLARRVRRQVRSRPPGASPVLDDPPAATPGSRREGVFALLAPHLQAERVVAARDRTEPGADLAVLASARRGLHRALRLLAGTHPDLRVRVGTDARIVETLPLGRLAYHDLVDAHWLELGGDRERGNLRVGTAGYLTVLFVEHDRAKNRYLALRKRAGRTDWTTLFVGHPNGGVAVGARPPHAASPVDAVYTWVDSGDPAWRESYQRHSEWCEAGNVSANNEERYADREELRYSLRSLWTFAPFVRHIYLVTAGQVPWWLAKDDPRVTVVPHREIFPDPAALPTFNSHAIESCLHRIPGLSEHVLYLNDDVFLGREVGEGDFFTHAGLAKVRLSPSQYIYQGEPEPSAIPTDWAAYNSLRLMRRDFALLFDRRVQHVPLPLRKSVMQEIEQRYPAEVERTRGARFRAVTDLAVPSMFAQFYGIATARAVEWPPATNEYVYLDTGRRDSVERFDQILRKRPTFFCLNATRHTEVPLATQARTLHEFLSAALPCPAPWELDLPAG